MNPPATRHLKWPALGAAAFGFFGLVWALWPRPFVSDVRVFDVDPGGSHLRVRYDSADKKTLLITRTLFDSLNPYDRFGTIYRYDAEAVTLLEIPRETWDLASGEIVTVESWMIPTSAWRVVADRGKLCVASKGRASQFVPTQGRTALRAIGDPTGHVIAALTTDGWERPGTRGWFTSFGGGYGGQHYVELFSVPDMIPVKSAIRIPFTNAGGIDAPCWSADGKYIVYASADKRRMIVIQTEPGVGELIDGQVIDLP